MTSNRLVRYLFRVDCVETRCLLSTNGRLRIILAFSLPDPQVAPFLLRGVLVHYATDGLAAVGVQLRLRSTHVSAMSWSDCASVTRS